MSVVTERQTAVIGDFVTANCWNPDLHDEETPKITRQGILAVDDPRTRYRAILGESGVVYMCCWNESVVVVPDKWLLPHTLRAVEFWRKTYADLP